MKWQVIKIRILQWLKKIVFYGLFITLVLFIVAFSLLQIPSIQKSLVSRATRGFSQVSGFNIEFDQFYLLWYDRLEIRGLTVTDPMDNTMIEAGNLFINFSLSSLYQHKDIFIDALSLQGGAVNLVSIPASDTARDLNINIFIAEIGKQFGGSGGGGRSPKINIGEVLVQQSQFSYDLTGRDSLSGFDYHHFRVALDEGNLNNFKVIGDTIEFNLESMQAKDMKTKLTIKEMSTFFRISQASMEFLGLNLKCNDNIISDTIIFKFNGQGELSDFNTKVNIDARFKNTKLYPQDLSLFTTGLEKLKEPILLNGRVRGKVNNFIFNPMRVTIGASTLVGSLEMDGLPAIRETFINARLQPSKIYSKDIAFVLPANAITLLGQLREIDLKGNFLGFINDFVADGDIITKFGHIKSDINYKISESNIGESSYSGKLELTDFDLGRFLNDTARIQKVTLNGRINGKGFTRETADFTLVGEIQSIGLRGYNYVNITSNARLARQFFSGDLKIDDPNLQLSMKGSIDLRPGKDLINVKARIDTALLHKLKLTQNEFYIQSSIDVDSRGLSLDSIVGTALFTDTRFRYKDEAINVDSVRLISENKNNVRKLILRSSAADLVLAGDYYYSFLFNDIEQLVREFTLNIRNNQEEIRQYYSSKRKGIHTYKAAFEATIHDVNPILHTFDIDMDLSKETRIQGEFANSITSNLHFFTNPDSVALNGQLFIGNEIEFNGSKVRDSTQSLVQVTVNSKRQVLNKTVSTKDLFLEGIWNKDHVDLSFDLNQEGYDNSLRLRSEIDFLTDSTKIKILPSHVKLLGNMWEINESNYTLVKGPEWNIHHLGISYLDQSVRINGAISRDPNPSLNVDIKNFDVSLLNIFFTEKFQGKLNAQVKQRDLYDKVFVENVFDIDSLVVNDFFVGEIRGNNIRDTDSDHINIDLTIDRLKNRIVDIKGYFDPKDQLNPLHTKAILEKANLRLLEPVVRDIFSRLDGTVTGVYNVEGTFAKPNISGEARIENGQVMINYLKTLYKVTGRVGITHDQIQFTDFELIDAFKNKGKLSGYIAHRSFSKMRVNLDASFTNFHLLNTIAKDNSLFYGQAFGTGNLNILGPISNLKISSTVTTNKNTRISIPVSGTATQEKKEFIQFASFTDSIKKKKDVKPKSVKRELSGITLDFDIDVTPDAYTEIIFDIKSGDIIRGRGRGDIKLQIDTKGEFNMFGLVDFTEGAYNFTLYDIINKEFSIKPGSRITWFGDPYEGNLNITASYRQLTSFTPILQDQSVANDPNLRRKYPVEVILKLDGPMLSPQINFDIDAKDLPNSVPVEGGKAPVQLRLQFNAFKAKLDEQEMKRQVFSLIILRRFSPPDAFETSGSLYNSVSELLSNQLSYWLSQVDQNLEIDLDLGTLDQEAFNTFQLRLSYSFLGGRLRVTRDGSFGNQQNKNEVATIAGDWTVDYLLTPDGKFKVKMYSRSTINQLQSTFNQTTAITTGASFIYTQNFNEFKDLLRSARDRRRKELEENPQLEESDQDEPKANH